MNWKTFTEIVLNESGLLISSTGEPDKAPLAIEVKITKGNLPKWIKLLDLPKFYTIIELRDHFSSILKGKRMPSREGTINFKFYKKDYPTP